MLLNEKQDKVKIGDFGISVCLRNPSKETEANEFQDFKGTVYFMAPEVFSGDNYGRTSDMWSLGCCIVEMATGQHPWASICPDVLKAASPYAINNNRSPSMLLLTQV